jgi:hypothetical protein
MEQDPETETEGTTVLMQVIHASFECMQAVAWQPSVHL